MNVYVSARPNQDKSDTNPCVCEDKSRHGSGTSGGFGRARVMVGTGGVVRGRQVADQEDAIRGRDAAVRGGEGAHQERGGPSGAGKAIGGWEAGAPHEDEAAGDWCRAAAAGGFLAV